MRLFDLGRIFLVASINAVINFLNAVFEPFANTIFVFNDWEPMANKSAIALGFVIVLAIAAIATRSKDAVPIKAIVGSAIATIALSFICGAIHFTIASGYAPNEAFLFWTRDVFWMVTYILVLLMAGVTVALACLRLFGTE